LPGTAVPRSYQAPFAHVRSQRMGKRDVCCRSSIRPLSGRAWFAPGGRGPASTER